MPSSPYASDFNGTSSDHLEVLDRQRFAEPSTVPSVLGDLLVAHYGRFAEEPTLAGVFALTDDARFVSYRCRVVENGGTMQVVTAHFGDTLAGIAIQDGRVVAELNDGTLAPVRPGRERG